MELKHGKKMKIKTYFEIQKGRNADILEIVCKFLNPEMLVLKFKKTIQPIIIHINPQKNFVWILKRQRQRNS